MNLRRLFPFVVVSITACGGGGGDPASSNNDPIPGNTGGTTTGVEESNFCPDNVVVDTNVVGNNSYEFLVSDSQCLGTVEDDVRVEKKAVSLELINDPAAFGLTISENVKITKTTMSFDPNSVMHRDYAEYFVAIDIENTSGIDYRFVGISDLKLLDENGNLIVDIDANLRRKGDLYYYDKENSWLNEVVNTSILSGSSKILLGDYVTDEIFDLRDVAKVSGTLEVGMFETEYSFGPLTYPLNSYPLDPITPTQLEWSVEQKFSYDYLNATVTFINTLDYSIKLSNSVFTIDFFDKDGYMLSRDFISLYEALGLDSKDDLTEDDYIIDASGGIFSLKYSHGPVWFTYNSQIKATVTKAVVHLDWEKVE